MFAIIKTGGKQVKVELGTEIFVEKLNGNENDQVTFDEVLMADGIVGNPFIKNGKVIGTIVKQGKGKKIRVVRYHPKKNVRTVYGHRQPYTKVRIDEILVGSPKAAAKPKVEGEGEAKPKTAAKPKTTTKSDAKSKTVAKPKTTKENNG